MTIVFRAVISRGRRPSCYQGRAATAKARGRSAVYRGAKLTAEQVTRSTAVASGVETWILGSTGFAMQHRAPNGTIEVIYVMIIAADSRANEG